MIDIRDVQILVFEIGQDCNLAPHHVRCPANKGVARYEKLDCSRPLDDDTILDTAKRFYGEFGFNGLIAYHYYNEPCLYLERMVRVSKAIRDAVPQSKFLLWTNGTLLPDKTGMLSIFDIIRVTHYGGQHSPVNLHCTKQDCSRIVVQSAHLDARLQELGQDNSKPCMRPYTEFILDCFANVHLCCIDWRGLASPGNVLRDGLDRCVAAWRSAAQRIVCDPMDSGAPEACRRCAMRFNSRSNFA